MSNALSVRRVQLQEIDEVGCRVGKPSYGVIASDSYASSYNDTFESSDELEAAIGEAGCILFVLDDHAEKWSEADPDKIGTENFYGSDWEK